MGACSGAPARVLRALRMDPQSVSRGDVLRRSCIAVGGLILVAVATGEPTTADELFEVGGHAQLEFTSERNHDLDASVGDDRAVLQPEIGLSLSLKPLPSVEFVVDLEARRDFDLVDEQGGRREETDLEIDQAFVDWTATDYLVFRAGRQDFDDEREWLYDENLDGLRVFLDAGDLEIELSATREATVRTDLLEPRTDEEPNNYHAYGRYAVTETVQVAAYWLHRHDRTSRDDHPTFYGLRSLGEPLDSLKYWLELSLVDGRERARDLRGYGADFGATYTFVDVPHTPYLTLAYAFGSGDRRATGGTDEAFRQTDLQDNVDAFGGVNTFKYYGEVLDPELSNLTILTGGVGFRPTPQSSIDVVYHHYRQVVASDELRSADIDADPTGERRDLGSEIDVVVGYREIPNLELELIVGSFFSGDAFTDGGNALLTRLQARYAY